MCVSLQNKPMIIIVVVVIINIVIVVVIIIIVIIITVCFLADQAQLPGAGSTPGQQLRPGGQLGQSSDTGPIKAPAPMWRCSRIMHMQRENHPTILASLEGIVDQVSPS